MVHGTCPQCGKTAAPLVVMCVHCGFMFTPTPTTRRNAEADYSIAFAQYFMSLIGPGFGILLGVLEFYTDGNRGRAMRLVLLGIPVTAVLIMWILLIFISPHLLGS